MTTCSEVALKLGLDIVNHSAPIDLLCLLSPELWKNMKYMGRKMAKSDLFIKKLQLSMTF